MQLDTRELVDPAFFSRLESIQLRTQSIVEGFMHGLHRSPYVGFSVEFSSHREYVPSRMRPAHCTRQPSWPGGGGWS